MITLLYCRKQKVFLISITAPSRLLYNLNNYYHCCFYFRLYWEFHLTWHNMHTTWSILQSNFNQGIVYPHGRTGILVNSLTPLPPLSARNSWKTHFKLTNFGYYSSNLERHKHGLLSCYQNKFFSRPVLLLLKLLT